MVSTLEKKTQNMRFFRLPNKFLSDFVVGNGTNADAIENETLEPQTSGIVKKFGRFTVG